MFMVAWPCWLYGKTIKLFILSFPDDVIFDVDFLCNSCLSQILFGIFFPLNETTLRGENQQVYNITVLGTFARSHLIFSAQNYWCSILSM